VESIEEGAFAHFSARKVKVIIGPPDFFNHPRLSLATVKEAKNKPLSALKLCEKAGIIEIVRDQNTDKFLFKFESKFILYFHCFV
jgi:hypothetical protein